MLQHEAFIESQYGALASVKVQVVANEYSSLYSAVANDKLRAMLSTLHYELTNLFRQMNERLPTTEYSRDFWADPSRKLIAIIEITLRLYNALKGTPLAFDIDEYYNELLIKCRGFLRKSGGSPLPLNMDEVKLYDTTPIFTPANTITITRSSSSTTFDLKLIGEGSYALVYKYKDDYYKKDFVLKRAKKDLSEKEIERFKLEFQEMKGFSSPYIVEVFCYDAKKNEYIMECMDVTLRDFIDKNNSTLPDDQRRSIVFQMFKAINYIHSKGRLHRDISPNNILIRKYDDVPVVKISDFGLIKIPESTMTTNTEPKGCFNDPALATDGFNNYGILHEIYALTRMVYFIMTGKTEIAARDDKWRAFVSKGINTDKRLRFQSVDEIIQSFKAIT